MRRRLSILIGLVFSLILLRGLFLIGYEPARSDSYIWGAFHVHSTLSDGLAPLEEIARQAREARVYFVFLSDHGPPHPKAALLNETVGGVRFIGGSEVGLPEGHLIVSDVASLPNYHLPPFPPDAAAEARAWGGFSVLTYPEDPTERWLYWEEDFVPDGIEIINVTSYFRASSHWTKLAWAVFSLFNRFYYISSFEPPTYALERWDALLERGDVFAVFAANAHGGFPLTEDLTIGVPSYETAMGFVGLGIEPRFKDAPEEAIRQGKFFAIVRGAGEPRRFAFTRSDKDDTLRVIVDVDVDGLAPRLVLKRNGAVVAETEEGELVHPAREPGIYRAEVYLRDHKLLDPSVPWILSNAIRVDADPVLAASLELQCDAVDAIDLEEFAVEKDDASTASLEGSLELSYHLSQATPDDVNHWVALAHRKPFDLSDYRGIYLEAASPEAMRYWLELRAGDRSYYASFKLEGNGVDSVTIPWRKFYAMFGGHEEIPLSEIDALFIIVNTANSRTGFSSELRLQKLGACR